VNEVTTRSPLLSALEFLNNEWLTPRHLWTLVKVDLTDPKIEDFELFSTFSCAKQREVSKL
jgi:hypothetical protein